MRPNRQRRVEYSRGFTKTIQLPYYRGGRRICN